MVLVAGENDTDRTVGRAAVLEPVFMRDRPGSAFGAMTINLGLY